MQTAYEFLPFVVFVISVFLAGLVLKSDWRTLRSRVFAAFLVAMSLWGLTIFGMRSSPNFSVAFQWEKAALIVIVFVSILFFHFTVLFTRSNISRWLVYGFYLSGAAMGVLSLTGLIAEGMQSKFYGFAPVLGVAFPVYLVAVYAPTFLALGLLFKGYRSSRVADEKNRIAYVALGALASLIGGTTDYLPALGLEIYPLGIVANIVFGVLATIAIVRYRLLELRVLMRKGFAYSLVSSVIFAVYGLAFVVFEFLFEAQTTTAAILATVAAVLLVAILLPPTVARIQQWVDRLFFRQRYDHLMALESFTSETRDISEFGQIANSLVVTVARAMQADWVVILLPHLRSGDFVVAGRYPEDKLDEISVGRHSMLARWLNKNERSLTPEGLEVDPYLQAMGDVHRKELREYGSQLFVPMKSKGELTGILLLGPRIVDQDYSSADIEMLTTVANQAAMVIENARLYNQERERLRELKQVTSLKSNLMHTVSHELKSPVTAIKTSADLLALQEANLAERQKERLLKTLQSGISRLERLIEESLDYAQMQSARLELNLEPASMSEVIEETIRFLEPSLGANGQKIILEAPEGLSRVLIDPKRVERVLLNLLTNASKYSPSNTEILVRLRQQESYLVTEVIDRGPGIPAEQQRFLFDEYYRGPDGDRQKGPGSGLGLTVAKHLVELHGGEIGVRTAAAGGSIFYFTLPLPPMIDQVDLEEQATTVS